MQILQYIIIGLLQGLTEFLPVSSSAHIVLGEHWLGINPPGVFFEVFLHLATLIAVILVYRADVSRVLCGRDWRLLGLLALATAITVVLIWPFKDELSAMTEAEGAVRGCGIALLITAAWLAVADWRLHRASTPRDISWGGAVLIGIAQAIAALPGISRSGATIGMAIVLGVSREAAARFSFLMSLPIILGAGIIELSDAGDGVSAGAVNYLGFGLAFITALLSGIAAIYLLLWALKRARLLWFALYCCLLGLTAIIIG